MHFDILTLIGVLVALPYIVMLSLFSRKRTRPGQQKTAVQECPE
jgi:hypothetical protein